MINVLVVEPKVAKMVVSYSLEASATSAITATSAVRSNTGSSTTSKCARWLAQARRISRRRMGFEAEEAGLQFC